MKTPIPWRKILIITLVTGLLGTIWGAMCGYNEQTYHPSGTGIAWVDPTSQERAWNTYGYGFTGLLCGAFIPFIMLLLAHWIWYFLLARMSEVSQAIRK